MYPASYGPKTKAEACLLWMSSYSNSGLRHSLAGGQLTWRTIHILPSELARLTLLWLLTSSF